MALSANLRSLLCLLLVLTCAHAFAVPWASSQSSSHHAAADLHASRSRSVFPQLTWLRDTAIEKVFGVPPKSVKAAPLEKSAAVVPASIPQLPSKLLAKYGGDVVLRFNLSSPDEEQALAEAADTLFLDVWEFTHNWADVRLREDDVGHCHIPLCLVIVIPLLTWMLRSRHCSDCCQNRSTMPTPI